MPSPSELMRADTDAAYTVEQMAHAWDAIGTPIPEDGYQTFDPDDGLRQLAAREERAMRVTPEDCLRQLAAREAFRVQVREHTCPPLLDNGPNPLWPEVQALTARVAKLEAECAERTAHCCTLQEQIQDLKSQLATAHARAAAFQQEADVQRQRSGDCSRAQG